MGDAVTLMDAPMSPERARLYKTAYFTDEARAKHGGPGLPTDPVRVVFARVAYNALAQEHQPVFSVYRTMEFDSFIGHFYAQALRDFVL